MHKIYLLLRNNQQSGPYSLEELAQSGLKPDDLLWVEGKSTGWFYPSELDDLKPYITPSNNIVSKPTAEAAQQPCQNPASKPAGEKKVFVSLPNKRQVPPAAKQKAPEDNIEQKAEVLRKRIQAYSAENKNSYAADIPDTDYPYSSPHATYNNSGSIFHAKTKKGIPPKTWAVAVVTVMLLATGFIIWQQSPEKTATATNAVNGQQAMPKEDIPAATDSLPDIAPDVNYDRPAIENEKEIHKASYATVHTNIPAPAAVPQPTNNKVAKANEDKTVKNDIPSADNPVTNTTEPTVNTTEKPTTAIPEKKKSLGKRIDDFFDRLKHKKEPETTTESPAPATTQPGSPERKSVHREDKPAANAEATADPASLVDVTANEPANSWMMGIRGLKITLRNRSNETIKSAKVEVRYYSEQNELLQKKIISFANIPPKQSATVPAPDHSLADHTDYALVSVSN